MTRVHPAPLAAALAGAALALAALPAATAAQPAPVAPAARPDVAKGKAQFARCMACHSVDPAKPRGIGPNLAGVVGRAAGKQPGFKYTPALAGARFKWTPEKLDAFIAKPREVVPGTNMVFAGIADPAARKALIAYLGTTGK
ncbi:c-type cytochrome [Novosphingobium soli]|uniref:C-type cytochrome n=1 Tax=Novosphingobium soli TaxID=574956 RepID=A0ABV6CV39_9SPHN